MVMLHINLKGIAKLSSMEANILLSNPYPATYTTPDPGDWVTRSLTTLSEHGNVTYQIKEYHKCSNMVANILLADPLTPHPGDGVSRSKLTFLEHGHVAYPYNENHEL